MRMETRCSRSWRVQVPGIGAVVSQMVSRATTETIILKRTILRLMASFLASLTRLRLSSIVNLAGKIEHADNLPNLRHQFD